MNEVMEPIDPIHSAMMLGMTPEPCEPVIEITRQAVTKLLDVVEFGDQLERVEKDRLVAFVKELLAQDQPELWATYSPGPGEIHPCMTKEHAEREAKATLAMIEKMKADKIARGQSVEFWPKVVVDVIPSPFNPLGHFELLAEETIQHRDDLLEYVKELEQKTVPATAAVNQQLTTAASPEPADPCNHEWIDDGQHLLVCTSCGEQEDYNPHWRDMATAPRDGTMLRLLVEFTEHSTEDTDQAPTIGANNFDHDGEDRWQFAGWCWSHDHFTQGQGEPIGWLPMLEEPRRIAAGQQEQQP